MGDHEEDKRMNRQEMPAEEVSLLAAVIANVPVGVLAADAELRCAYANERLASIAGRTSGELQDHGLIDAVAPDDRLRLRHACEAVVADHRELVEEVILRTPEGADRHAEVRLTPLTAADGVARGVVGVVQEQAPPAEEHTVLTPTIGYVAQLD